MKQYQYFNYTFAETAIDAGMSLEKWLEFH